MTLPRVFKEGQSNYSLCLPDVYGLSKCPVTTVHSHNCGKNIVSRKTIPSAYTAYIAYIAYTKEYIYAFLCWYMVGALAYDWLSAVRAGWMELMDGWVVPLDCYDHCGANENTSGQIMSQRSRPDTLKWIFLESTYKCGKHKSSGDDIGYFICRKRSQGRFLHQCF